MTPSDFVLARVAEDEAFARQATGSVNWEFGPVTAIDRIVYKPQVVKSRKTGKIKKFGRVHEVKFRLRMVASALLPFLREHWENDLLTPKPQFRLAWVHLTRKQRNLPDGQVNGNLTFWMEDGQHIERHDPARVLRQCEAFRRVAQNADRHHPGLTGYGASQFAVKVLTWIWDDHPDFNPKWRNP